MRISLMIREKHQWLGVVRGFTVFISEFCLLQTIPTQPVTYYVLVVYTAHM